MVLDMLKDNPAPHHPSLFVDTHLKNDIAWKTGTSWAFRDAWAIGVSGDYVLAVWIGNFDGKGNASYIGRSAAGPLLFSMFDFINPKRGWRIEDAFSKYHLNLKKVAVCSATGDLFEKHCKPKVDTWFIPGLSPIKSTNIYRKIPIVKKTGLRACTHEEGITQMKLYEFWSSDFLNLFRQAGISLKTPPPYEKNCAMNQKSTTGINPIISSPQATLEYVIQANTKKGNLIPFKAILDSDATLTHWFIDGRYLGNAPKGKVFIWQATPGTFIVKAVDDLGREMSKKFVVNQIISLAK
jgi:penicillin-binding protein 1C